MNRCVAVLLSLSLAACAAPEAGDELEDVAEHVDELSFPTAYRISDVTPIRFPAATAKIYTNAAAFEADFGVPAGVNFASSWVAYWNAGSAPSGYYATVTRVDNKSSTYTLTTRLDPANYNCQIKTREYAFAYFNPWGAPQPNNAKTTAKAPTTSTTLYACTCEDADYMICPETLFCAPYYGVDRCISGL